MDNLPGGAGSDATIDAPPHGLLSYQGRLLQDGSPYDGDIDVTFRLYTVETGGIAFWEETQTVSAVWNCGMAPVDALTDVVAFTVYTPGVCIDLTSITIVGPSVGTPGTYTFTTSYEPPTATTPITYEWDNGDATDFSIRTLGLGTHVLVVTATNCTAAQVTDTHTIVMDEEISIYLPIVFKSHSP